MGYGYLGAMRTKPGLRDDVIAHLVANLDGDPMPGCELYVVTADNEDADLIRVTEIWSTKEAHDASLSLPAVRASITAVMPMLTGDFESHEVTVRGAFGVAG